MDSYFSQKQQFEVKTSQWWICFRFCLLQMLTDGLECCDVFIRLSFWRHPFTAEHPLTLILTAPIHCRASIDSHSHGTHSLQSIHWLSFWRHPFTAEHPLTLILTAPIHCRASIAETLMQCYISPNLMKKQTHPNLEWPKDENMLSKYSFLGELSL